MVWSLLLYTKSSISYLRGREISINIYSEGKALAELAFNNRTLRDALIATTESVAVGIHIENWSAYRLWSPEYEMEKGRTYSEEAAKLAGTLPGTNFLQVMLKGYINIKMK